MTHAFFKALLFLAAGSVIIALHHEQDIRRMGGLRKIMPITWITFLIGTLALVGTPGFAGFYSKDSIIEAVRFSNIPGSGFAYLAVLLGVFVTALYSFRLYFLVFHGPERLDPHVREHAHESPWVVTVPLILLAIPSVMIGYLTISPVLFGDFFAGAIYITPARDAIAHHLGEHFHGPFSFALHGLLTPAFWLAFAGAATAWYLYMKQPELPAQLSRRFATAHRILEQKYGFDEFNQAFFAGGSRKLGGLFWHRGDVNLIDGLVVNGTAKTVGWFAGIVRHVQSGYLYHYAFAMIIGLLALLSWVISR
jgi:NADH-quinone oxidoreductase subunit L